MLSETNRKKAVEVPITRLVRASSLAPMAWPIMMFEAMERPKIAPNIRNMI